MMDLLPCPHCNSDAAPKSTAWDGDPPMPGWYVVCSAAGWDGMEGRGCGCSGAYGETKEDAIAAWNRRSSPSPTGGEAGAVAVKALEWSDERGSYASFKFGPETIYYSVDLAVESLDVWSVDTGVIGSEFGRTEIHKCIGREAAKAAAQADYERRILSALTHPAPLMGKEVSPELCEECGKFVAPQDAIWTDDGSPHHQTCLPAAPLMDEVEAVRWQDMDSAPKDGSGFLAWDGFSVFLCFFNGGSWQDQPTCSPRPHAKAWVPLPSAPALTKLQEDGR